MRDTSRGKGTILSAFATLGCRRRQLAEMGAICRLAVIVVCKPQ